MNEMCLIEISGAECDLRPVNSRPRRNLTKHLLKSPHAAKKFGRESDLIAKNVDEAARAQPDLLRNRQNLSGLWRCAKLIQRECDCRMTFWLTGDGKKFAFQNSRFGLRSRRFDQSLA